MRTILFLGSNPSQKSTCDVAFHGSTKSSKILTEWCKDLVGAKMHLNVVNRKTEDNRPLKTSEIKENLDNLRMEVLATQADKIVALGKTAAKALTLLGLDFYEMPHPSGCNRQLNDPKFVEGKIKGLVEYCNPTNPDTNSN